MVWYKNTRKEEMKFA